MRILRAGLFPVILALVLAVVGTAVVSVQAGPEHSQSAGVVSQTRWQVADIEPERDVEAAFAADARSGDCKMLEANVSQRQARTAADVTDIQTIKIKPNDLIDRGLRAAGCSDPSATSRSPHEGDQAATGLASEAEGGCRQQPL